MPSSGKSRKRRRVRDAGLRDVAKNAKSSDPKKAARIRKNPFQDLSIEDLLKHDPFLETRDDERFKGIERMLLKPDAKPKPPGRFSRRRRSGG